MGKKEPAIIKPKTLATYYRAKVIDAYRNRRIFTVYGNFNVIRRSLLERGWLEKLSPGRHTKLQSLSEDVLLLHAKRGNNYEVAVISKIINHFPAFFIWQPKSGLDLYKDVYPYRNRIRIGHAVDFSTKVGLIGCAEKQDWFRIDGIARMCYPRFFRLGVNQEERLAFIDEYHITQCCSLLRFLIRNLDKYNEIIDYENGAISITVVHFSLGRVNWQLDDWDNCGMLDIEKTKIPEEEWSHFLENSNEIINKRQKIKCTYHELAEITETSRRLLAKLEEKHPDLKWDGYKNMWILKPGYLNRGNGIVVLDNLNEILQWSTTHSNRHYIIQKYIEQPLLIYNTKFDIRQYMLIYIRESTVQVWLYTDCYLRFCSEQYSIDDFRESIHLTNNCVQKKYKIQASRDARLPKNNMWSLEEFKGYLKSQKVATDIWENRIFPGFRENLCAAILSSLDETSLIKNSFELFGCDFMLDEEYNPVLIEINSTPDLSPSTDITARICPMAMQDCVKVIVDSPRDSRASTGQFRKVYEVNYELKHDLSNTETLHINGKSLELHKQERLSKQKNFIKSHKNEKQQIKKRLPEEKAEASVSNSGMKGLKSAVKEALALRYTMPK